jgi:hypothetical protein
MILARRERTILAVSSNPRSVKSLSSPLLMMSASANSSRGSDTIGSTSPMSTISEGARRVTRRSAAPSRSLGLGLRAALPVVATGATDPACDSMGADDVGVTRLDWQR